MLIFLLLTFLPNVLFFVQFIYTIQSLTIVPVSIDLLTIEIIMAIKDPNSIYNLDRNESYNRWANKELS